MPKKTQNGNGKSHLSSRLSPETVEELKRRLGSGDSPAACARVFRLNYMTVYRIATGSAYGASERLIPERGSKITDQRRNWAERAARRGMPRAEIARKLGVTLMSVGRLLADARALRADQIRADLLTSGDRLAVARKWKINEKQLDEAVTL